MSLFIVLLSFFHLTLLWFIIAFSSASKYVRRNVSLPNYANDIDVNLTLHVFSEINNCHAIMHDKNRKMVLNVKFQFLCHAFSRLSQGAEVRSISSRCLNNHSCFDN